MTRRLTIDPALWLSTRREWMHRMGLLGGGALLGGALSGIACSTSAPAPEEETPALAEAGAASDPLTAQRATMAQAPIAMTELGAGLVMLAGPGGNVVVSNGRDGKFVVDTFVLPAWMPLETALAGLGPEPVTAVINTHWHFDHTDNNAHLRAAGARIIAHANTLERLSESHDLLGMHIDPAPEAGRPTETFMSTQTLQANGETMALAHLAPAHTDTDIIIHYTKANVIHVGDLCFNGMYPFIDAGTGGAIDGMVAGAERVLEMADASTTIVPGHGPLADKAALTRYRDMLATARDRVQKLKSAGGTLEEVQAAAPTADLDKTWGMGVMGPNDFVALVYNTL